MTGAQHTTNWRSANWGAAEPSSTKPSQNGSGSTTSIATCGAGSISRAGFEQLEELHQHMRWVVEVLREAATGTPPPSHTSPASSRRPEITTAE